ncbi:MAG: hypothetical protein M1831_003212 [Alyxoria varia]|nr:MAG: hypothetical protein M1831_003212 [Alyxoria varia]
MANHAELLIKYLITLIGVIIVGGVVVAASAALWENEEVRQWIIQTWENTADAVEDFTDNLLNVPNAHRRRQRHPIAVPAGGRGRRGSGRYPPPPASGARHEMKENVEGLRRRKPTRNKDDPFPPASTSNGPSDPASLLYDARSNSNGGDPLSHTNTTQSSIGEPTPPSSHPGSTPASPHPASAFQSPPGIHTPTFSDPDEVLEHDLSDTLRAIAVSSPSRSPPISAAHPATNDSDTDATFDTSNDARSATTETASLVDPSEHLSDESDNVSNADDVHSLDSYASSWAGVSEPSGDEGTGNGLQGGY